MAGFGGVSLRFKLILTSIGLIAGMLLGLGLLAHQWEEATEILKLDTYLSTDINSVATAIGTILPASGASPEQMSEQIHSPEFNDFLNTYFTRRMNTPAAYKTTLAIFDDSGSRMASSNNALPLDNEVLLAANTASSVDATQTVGESIISINTQGLAYRMITYPIRYLDQTVLTLRLACLLSPTETAARDFDRTLFFLLAAIGLLSGFGSVLLITRTLHPVNLMSQTAASITERNLDTPIPETPGNDEISRLAKTFNKLLARVGTAYEYQVRLVEDLSHQLKTPLAIMRGSVELVLRRDHSKAEYRQVLEDSLADIDRVSSFLITMLGLARLESQKVTLAREPCNMAKLVIDLIEDMEPLWMELQLHFYLQLTDASLSLRLATPILMSEPIPPALAQSLTVSADATLISQALMNLLSNAFKFCPPGGKIDISLSAGTGEFPEACRLLIANNGPPIPSEALETIFERFYSKGPESNAAPLHGQGFGLGLNIARNIVELHQGKIRAFNPPEGGAAFEILLPLDRSSLN